MKQEFTDETFEKLVVWQRAQALGIEVHRLLSDCKDWGFKDQITRSTNSIADNIAEGAECPGKAEYRQFLGYAKGSAGESRSQVYRAKALNYITEADTKRLVPGLKEISKMINGLRNSLREHPSKP